MPPSSCWWSPGSFLVISGDFSLLPLSKHLEDLPVFSIFFWGLLCGGPILVGFSPSSARLSSPSAVSLHSSPKLPVIKKNLMQMFCLRALFTQFGVCLRFPEHPVGASLISYFPFLSLSLPVPGDIVMIQPPIYLIHHAKFPDKICLF